MYDILKVHQMGYCLDPVLDSKWGILRVMMMGLMLGL